MERYYKLQNADGKVWLMPARHMRTAMELYQPSGRMGKLLKRWFPWLHRLPFVRKRAGAEKVAVSLPPELGALLRRLWGEEPIEYSVFNGSPGPRQKVTMQVFRGERILGYVKTSESEVIADLFERETRTLRQLRALGVESIPEALFCGRADGRFVFVQSTEKTLHSKVPDVFGESHRDWLEALYRKTRRTTPFEETALKVDLEYLREETSVLDTRLRGIFAQAITLTEAHYAAQREFGFIHGDFTPWNLYEEAGTLHPFDFEYASEGYPAFLDAVHFLLQIQILVEKRTQEEAFAALEQQKHWIPTEDRNFLILAYLLHIIAHYMRLFGGRFMGEDNSFIIWTGLIENYIRVCQIEKS